MPQITNELMYGLLKSIQAQVAIVHEDMDSIKTRLTAQDGRLSQMLGAMAGLHGYPAASTRLRAAWAA